MHEFDEDELRVYQLIKAAFGDVPFPFAQAEGEWRSLVHQLQEAFGEEPYRYDGSFPGVARGPEVDMCQWYFDLPLFSSDTFQWVLPRLLVHLFGVYPERGSFTDSVVSYMDVAGIADRIERLKPYQQNHHPWQVDTLVSVNQRSFSLFTGSQIRAMIEWLLLIRTWDEGDLAQEIDRALSFWTERSGDAATP
jgi:hypothetical protein